MKTVEIKKSKSCGWDEWWTEAWDCSNPKCDYGGIFPNDRYCGGCGAKINWIEDREEIEKEK